MPSSSAILGRDLPKSEALMGVARRLVWWLTPEETLELEDRFLAQVMTLGTWDDVQCVRGEVGDAGLREVLRHPPAGVFDLRSWHYWHHFFGIDPVPPLPRRQLP